MPKLPTPARRLALKARHILRVAREAADARIQARRRVLPLERAQRRLELLITAMYDRPITIASPNTPSLPWFARAWRLIAPNSGVRETIPESEAEKIHLPEELPARGGTDAALARYRLFAIEQAERIVRGTAAHVPVDTLERDLYLLREGAAIDAHIATSLPGMRETLARERAFALTTRPKLEKLNGSEREVELMVRETLSSAPEDVGVAGPSESANWAQKVAAQVRRESDFYHGLPPAQLWGTVHRDTSATTAPNDWRRETARPLEKIVARKFSWGQTTADSDAATGRARGVSAKYTVRGQAPSGTGGESEHMTDQTDARSQPRAEHRPDSSGQPAEDTWFSPVDRPDLVGAPPAVWYDEWDADAGTYLKRAAAVRLAEPVVGDDRWAIDTLAAHAGIVRQVRHQFERLRARRTLLPRQRVGDELDLPAVVTAMVDRRSGRSPDDRFYRAARPARRELAIAILIDTSGSTKAQVSDGRSILDLEKISVLLAMEALEVLGDRFAAYAFAGKTAENVMLMPIKTFEDRGLDSARRAVGALEGGGFTRLGAAMRFATHELARQSAGHRLLLILSDGRPNDVDRYQGPYGVEDSRQAIMEARASGVFPFCITVDHDASEYLPRIFGAAGHTILQRAEQLPTALFGAVRVLIRRP